MSRHYRVLHRSRKVDANQAEIVAGLRALGYSVQPLSAIGKGVPDLLVGGYGMNLLLEVKDPAQDCPGGELRKAFPKEHGGLNEDQFDWHRRWIGQVAVVRTLDDAVQVIRKHCGGDR